MTAVATSLEDLGAIQHLAYVLQLTVGSAFLFAVIAKLRDPAAFSETVTDYGIVGPRLAGVAAPAVIAIECFLAFALLTGALVELGLVVAGATLVAFGGVTAVNLRRGRDAPCGCFGDSAERVSARGLARIGLLLLALLAIGIAYGSGEADAVTLSDLSTEGTSALRYLVAIGGTAAAVMLATAMALRARELMPLLRYLRARSSHGAQPERSSV